MKSLMFSTVCWWIFTVSLTVYSAIADFLPYYRDLELPGFVLGLLWVLSLPLAVLGSVLSYAFSKKQTRTASYFQLVLPLPILLWLIARQIWFLHSPVTRTLLLIVLIGLLILATQQVKILRQKRK